MANGDNPFEKYRTPPPSDNPFAKYAPPGTTPAAADTTSKQERAEAEFGAPGFGEQYARTVVPPIVNTLDYPIRAGLATGAGLLKAGLPTDEASREKYYKAREGLLQATEIPETEGGAALREAFNYPGQMVGAGISDVAQKVLGEKTAAALGPYAQAIADVTPLGKALHSRLTGEVISPKPGVTDVAGNQPKLSFKPFGPVGTGDLLSEARRRRAAERSGSPILGKEPLTYSLAPEQIGKPGLGTKALAGLSGKYKKWQSLSDVNQEVTNKLAARAIGLPDDEILTDAAIARARAPAKQAYEAVSKAAPETLLGASTTYKAKVALVGVKNAELQKFFPEEVPNPKIEELRRTLLQNDVAPTEQVMKKIAVLRADATKNFRTHGPGSQEDHDLGVAQRQAADLLESQIEESISKQHAIPAYRRLAAIHKYDTRGLSEAASEANNAVAAELRKITPADKARADAVIGNFQRARQLFAKIHDVDDARNAVTGNVDARRIYTLRSKVGKPLTGELKQIADAAEGFGRVTQRPESYGGGSEDFSVLDVWGAGTALATGHPAAAIPFITRPIGRHLLANPVVQSQMLNRTPFWQSPSNAYLASVLAQPQDSLARALDY